MQVDARPIIDVLVQGRPSVDLTFMGLTEMPQIGEEYYVSGFGMNPGACFTTVAALQRLGLRTGFATDLGNDFFSRYLLDQLRATGIDETFIRFQERDLSEVSVGLSFPHDRTFITYDAGRDWQGRHVLLDDLLRYRVRALFTHAPFSEAVFGEARRQGIPIFVDAFWDLTYLASSTLQRSLEQADVFMPNLKEALVITDAATAEEALDSLMARVPMVAIKMGTMGAIGGCDGRVYRTPVLPVAAIDTTGAGDNFDAGFIYGLLHDLPFVDCLRCAVVAGSLSTTYPGGVHGSPTEEALQDGLRVLAGVEAARSVGTREPVEEHA